ncbi:MAG TPA: hypothetical protein VFP50_17335 [Anaeromyxobacteraceae bacterium]|nr:hypothetical protein [Anaeromyxobacteraceae bacterium]
MTTTRPNTLLALALAAALLPLTARAAEPGAARREAGWSLDWRLAALAGGFSGHGVWKDSGGLAVVEGALTPTLHSGAFKLELPVRFGAQQTLGASLSEYSGSAGVAPEWKVRHGLRLGVEAGLTGAFRPDWPDLYQRDVSGHFTPTDRYSYLAWRAGATLWAQPVARQHLKIRYHYVSYDFRRDPSFDPSVDAEHLTPRDNGQHHLDVSYRFLREGGAVGLRVEGMHRQDSVYLARHALTGSTSFGTTPTQRLDQVEPSVEAEWKDLGGAVDLSLRYGWQVQRDPFEGYYSYTGHHPRAAIDWRATGALSVRLEGEAWLRTYGPNSKANTEDGKRLEYQKVGAAASLRYALGGGLSLEAEGSVLRETTNYPNLFHDLVTGPNQFGQYTVIDFDYTNWKALAGVEWRG